jgi:transcriptional regulator of acetoin/glycerol metabolism
VYEHEGRKEGRVSPEVISGLVRREYARGVRELDRILVEAMSKSKGDTILPTKETAAALAPVNKPQSQAAQLEAVLERHGWVISAAAKELGMTRASLRRRIDKHGLSPASSDARDRGTKPRK